MEKNLHTTLVLVCTYLAYNVLFFNVGFVRYVLTPLINKELLNLDQIYIFHLNNF